jgi:hypothetical protein
MRTSYFMGLDLGQPGESTGFAVLERLAIETLPTEPEYRVRHLERFPPGASYPTILEEVVARAGEPPLLGSPMVVDTTAVGQVVIDRLRNAKLSVTPVIISAGQSVQPMDRGGFMVPKKDLVTGLQMALQGRRLKVAPGLQYADLLVSELTSFRLRRVTLAETEDAEWRVGRHDDLVFAVALACWFADRFSRDRPTISYGPSLMDQWVPGRIGGMA